MALTEIPIELSSTPGIVDNSNATAITIDSSENVGIGTTPIYDLDILDTSETILGIRASDSSGTNVAIRFQDAGTGTGVNGLYVGRTADKNWFYSYEAEPLVFGTSATEAMRIDASGNVGIGTDSPAINKGSGTASALHLYTAAASPELRIERGNGTDFSITASTTGGGANLYSSHGMTFHTNSTTRAVDIDTSGNLLVGKTAAGFANTGHELRGGGSYAAFTRDGGSPVLVNRKSSDGTLVEYMKDGTAVGSIGTWDSDFVIGQVNVAFKFDDGSNQILPWSVGSNLNRDNAITLGASDSRFKDLYLSGTLNGISTTKSASGNRWGILPEVESNGVMEVGRYLDFHLTDGDTSDYGARIDFDGTNIVSTNAFYMSSGIYLGGSGAANKLEDYEEGTWTPQVDFGGSDNGVTYGIRQGRYTKIGRMVSLSFNLVLSNKGSQTGQVTITGAPFGNYTASQNNASPIICEGNGSSFPDAFGMVWSDNKIYVRYQGATSKLPLYESNFTNSTQIFGTMTYETA